MTNQPRVIPAGERFARLVVARTRQPGEARIACICDCGAEHEVAFTAWGRTKSCGCLNREVQRAAAALRPTQKEPCAEPGHTRQPDAGRPGKFRCRDCHLAGLRRHMQRKRDEIRDAVLAAYGRACACCDEHREVFLTVDHMDGSGSEHRRELASGRVRRGGSYTTYRWLQAHDWPSGYQLLCFNCNYAKHHLGECPHQTERRSDGEPRPAV